MGTFNVCTGRALLATILLVACMARLSSGQCSGGENIDRGLAPFGIAAPLTSSTCSSASSAGSDIEIVQLFTPESLPWNYSEVCFSLMMEGNVTGTQSVSVNAYYEAADGGPASAPFFWARANITVASGVRAWHSVETGGLVVTRPRVFIGVNVSSACAAVTYFGATVWATRLSLWRTPSGTWAKHGATAATANATAILVRAIGVAGKHVPAGWTCAASLYSDKSDCDCNCGVWDPDCSSAVDGATSTRCTSATATCDRSGACIEPGWNTSIAGCALDSFGSGDGCQCGCGGTMDPDCRDSSAAGSWYPAATNCGSDGVYMCSDSGSCVVAWSVTSSCNATRYNDGKTCDCGCQTGGVMDPDCMITNTSTCSSGAMCLSGSCVTENSVQPITSSSSNDGVPSSWTCEKSYYNSGDGCHCSCGAWDPDCLIQTGTNTKNCPSGYVCRSNGTCVARGCGNGVIETLTEVCDGGIPCRPNCVCKNLYKASSPVGLGCVPICGDGIIVSTQPCDGGSLCSKNCSCVVGSSAYSPARVYCMGCGNGVHDDGEECDGGEGCRSNCTCITGWGPTDPASTFCRAYSSNSSTSKSFLAIYVGVPVGASGAIALIAFGVALNTIRRRKRREAPNLPVDIGTMDFVPAANIAEGQQNLPYIDSGNVPKAYLSSSGTSSAGQPTAYYESGVEAQGIYPVTVMEQSGCPSMQFAQLHITPGGSHSGSTHHSPSGGIGSIVAADVSGSAEFATGGACITTAPVASLVQAGATSMASCNSQK